ncbi:hypothetical protein ACNAW0_15110 [Micromonospora sp. SL1-18]|uniref:hypothetical protein n=1 Tax=Micromonospora sp. SL1-18 TaxID=3399128 RepID=UPI003A4E3CC7
MRRMFSLGSVLVAGVLAATMSATPVVAAGNGGRHGWVPAPQPSFDQPAGARCDFPIHLESVVDEVRKLVLAEFPDGSPRREMYQGALLVRVTNTATGASTLVDAGGMAMVEYALDGSMTWYVTGPVLFGFGENAGTLPRGEWLIDGQFIVKFSPSNFKTLTMVHGTTHNVCTDLD